MTMVDVAGFRDVRGLPVRDSAKRKIIESQTGVAVSSERDCGGKRSEAWLRSE